jgi:DNA-binding PadR family transcriptional regulator
MMILGNATTNQPVVGQEESSSLRIHSRVARQLVDIEILYLLNFGAKSGYELRKSLSRSFGIKVSYGTLYPHLHALEKGELIVGTWSSSKEETPARSSLKKRVYDLTSHGAMVLKESIEKLGRISMTMQLLLNNVDLRQSSTKVANQNSTEIVNSIASILSKHELVLESSSNEKGASGLEHSIELLAKSKNGSKIMIRVINGEDKFDLDQAFKVLVVSNDIQAKMFLLASPPLKREVSDLCNFYHMKLFEGETWNVVLSSLDEGLSG